MLPPDGHVHTEWSWDALAGSMEASCARAVALGLPAIAFTDHMDLTRWMLAPERRAELRRHAHLVGGDGRFDPPPLDTDGYLECVQRCRERFGDLRILTGVELGEPHWFADETEALLATVPYDRVLGSLHSLEVGGERWLVTDLFRDDGPARLDPHEVLRAYFAETVRMIEASTGFAVLAHVDYPIRAWPAAAGTFDPADVEEELRAVLAALARSGRALEVSTVVPTAPEIVGWWRDCGGGAVTFGSDAHEPDGVARGFAAAVAMVEAHGFAPGRDPTDVWRRR